MARESLVCMVESVGDPIAAGPVSALSTTGAPAFPHRRVRLRGREQAALLSDDSANARVFARVLETLKDGDHHAFARIVDDRISEIGVPIIGHVTAVDELSTGEVLVSIDQSSTRFVLRRHLPERDEFVDLLRQGLSAARLLQPSQMIAIVKSLESNDIVYVELVDALRNTNCSQPAPESDTEEEITNDLTPVDRRVLDSQLPSLLDDTCDPDEPAGSCIPFNAVRSYCWLRAHLLCEALAQAGIDSAKLWVYAESAERPLRVPTDCLPTCETAWDYHVVTVARDTDLELRVVDPSIFPRESVPLSTFTDLVGPVAASKFTRTETYNRPPGRGPIGACSSAIQRDRVQARAELQLMKALPEGAPPYAACRRP